MKYKGIIFIMYLFITFLSYGEERINIFTSASYLPAKMYNIGVEIPNGKNKSIEYQAFYYNFILGEGYSSGIFGKYKFYSKSNYSGWFSSIFLESDYIKSKEDHEGFFQSEEGKGFGVMIGIEGGYKIAIKNKIGISFSVLPGYRYELMNYDNENYHRDGFILLPDVVKVHITF